MILALETATPFGSVALVSGGAVRAEIFLPPGPRASGAYISAVEALFAAAGAATGDVSAVAVSAGPGAFTGLRVGMSAAKGFCFGWGAPLVSVPTLLALAHRFPGDGRVVCPVQDARRGEVYAALFRWDGGEVARLSPDMAIAPALLPGRIPDADALFCGDGVAPFGTLFREAMGDRAILVSGDEGLPRASAVGIVGERIFRDGGAEDPRTAVPFYLRTSGTEFPLPRP
ncbi:MAG TPA: tRNA (adenosine(37)-N6)-threonylcarbamoyltransferase complex dimerization subunit type 1 TsaB [Candidatus Deferrimicrobium sp.]